MKILAMTGNRADYDLMSTLYKYCTDDPDVDFRLLVTGSHLSHAYGHSVDEIYRDGFNILAEVENVIDSDRTSARLESLSIFLLKAIPIVSKFNPDLIIYAGDREDVMAGALLGIFMKIPTIHFFAGDHASDGNVDNALRHAVSKLSSVLFVSMAEHKKRLLKLGENEERIFIIGSPQLDRFYKNNLPPVECVIRDHFRLAYDEWKDYAILMFYPILGEEELSGEYFQQILDVLLMKRIKAFVSFPNIDAGNKKIMNVIGKYRNKEVFFFYKNLKRDIFITLYKNAKFQIGNSSSGIIESASIPLPVINVGRRQEGRTAPPNVIFVKNDTEEISNAIDRVSSPDFLQKIKDIKNPYGDGKSSLRAYKMIKKLDFERYVFKKEDPLLL